MDSLFSSTLDTVTALRLRKIKEKSPTPWYNLRWRKIKEKSPTPWYNEHTRAIKRAAWKMERSWIKK